MENFNDDQGEKYQDAIKALRGLPVESSPYLKTRVLANVKDQQAKKGLSWFHLFTGSLLTGVLVLVISFQAFHNSQGEIIEVGKPYMVKADLRTFDSIEPSYIKIELIGQVQFSSDKFRQIKQMRELTLSWDKMVGKQYLPVVVKGLEPGTSHVKIHFYDQNNNVIRSQDYKFDFQKGSS